MKTITAVDIAFYKGSERISYFDIKGISKNLNKLMEIFVTC